MIYQKMSSEDLNITFEIPLDIESLYCKCPDCGKEVHLDDEMIKHIVNDEGLDFYSTRFLCNECAKKILERKEVF